MQFIVVACRCAIWPLQKKLNWICFAAIWKNILDCCSINHYIFVSITFVIHVKMNCSDVERKLSQILSLFSIGNLMNLSLCVYFHLLIKIKSNYKLKSNWLVVNSTKCIHFIEQDYTVYRPPLHKSRPCPKTPSHTITAIVLQLLKPIWKLHLVSISCCWEIGHWHLALSLSPFPCLLFLYHAALLNNLIWITLYGCTKCELGWYSCESFCIFVWSVIEG